MKKGYREAECCHYCFWAKYDYWCTQIYCTLDKKEPTNSKQIDEGDIVAEYDVCDNYKIS